MKRYINKKNKMLNAAQALILAGFVSGFFPAVSQAAVNIVDYGAKGDGQTDNLNAINQAIAAAQAKGDSVYVPAGQFNYSYWIRLDSVKIYGDGPSSILYSTNVDNSAIFLYGTNPGISKLMLTGVKTTIRQGNWEGLRIVISGASGWIIENNTLDGSKGAGIQTRYAANNGIIRNNIIKNTNADSIHMTDEASYITVDGNWIENSGDDNISIIGYLDDGGPNHDITVRNNVALNNYGGRGLTTVGGTNVLYENNYVENNFPGVACLYLAQEYNSSYQTYGAINITAKNNTFKNCGSTSKDHGAVMIFTDKSGSDFVQNITLTNNDISQSAPGTKGVRVFGPRVSNILLDSNRIVADIPLQLYDLDVKVIPYTSRDKSGPVGTANIPTLPTSRGKITALSASPADMTAQQGKTFTLNYNFTGGPTDVNYNVTVNFVDANGAVIFSDSHTPMVPTTQWTSTAKYKRTVTVPAIAAAGAYKIIVALSNPAAPPANSSTFLPSNSLSPLLPGSGVPQYTIMGYQIGTLNVVAATPATPITISAAAFSSATPSKGKPLTITYKFSGGAMADLQPVFVDFVNAKNNVAFKDDHTPPKSTNIWSGNYQYSRTITLPSNLTSGTYKVLVSFDSKAAQSTKLIAGSGVAPTPDFKYQIGTIKVP